MHLPMLPFQVTATYYMVNNLWRSFVGAIACIIAFQALQDFELVETVPPTQIAYEPRVGWEYGAFAVLGVLQGLLSALIVQLMSTVAKFIKRRGFLRPVAARMTTAFVVCTLAAACQFVLPMGRRQSTWILDDLFDEAPLVGRAHHAPHHAPDHAPGHGPNPDSSHGLGHSLDRTLGSWSMCDTPLYAFTGGGHSWGRGKFAEAVTCSPTFGLALFSVVELLLLLFSIVLPVPSGCFMPIFILGAVRDGASLRAGTPSFAFPRPSHSLRRLLSRSHPSPNSHQPP